MIAGLIFTFTLYVLSETTFFFERIAEFFTGIQPPATAKSDKSLERFFADHYTKLCMVGPALVFILVAYFYIRVYSRKLN